MDRKFLSTAGMNVLNGPVHDPYIGITLILVSFTSYP